MIEVKNVNKQYKLKGKKITAVDNLSLQIEQGEAVAYIGTNGAGKSTTIKMLTGIIKPTSGDVKVMGLTPYKSRRALSSNIGVVFGQRSQLIWDLPPIDSFNLSAKIYRIPNAVYKERLENILNLFNVSEFINQPVRQLSLGQRMCCEIILSLLHNPKLLFLDEPTIGLDIFNKEAIRNFILHVKETLHTTIFLTSHDLVDVETICDRVILLNKGKKIYDGKIEDLKSQFSNYKTMTFLLKEPLLEIPELDNLPEVNICYSEKSIEISFSNETIDTKSIIDIIYKMNIEVLDITIENISLEEIIKKVTA